ncbi:AfsR/SARP family transcriptional regulator [Allorhizocola rhizosphaerae]|uniref:AfsR/SARP family transcriptional regulator n=1 Tax=Allorhizocola rhizosphaerae TaxID=1872709 RepID=UPI000E3D8A6C|nr:AfsR/SARP family transcriptional regulator [Allorhizocola rhizosphaerae]
MRLEIRLLGPLEVAVDGEPVRFTGRPAVLLLVLAISAGRIVSLDRLATALWGEALPDNPRASVQTVVNRLRRLVGADRIETHPTGYLLRAEPDEVDAQHFLNLLHLASSTSDTLEEHSLLTEALTLWRGTPFEGMRSAWLADSEARQLVERYLTAVERRSDLDLAAERHDGLVVQLQSLISRYPLRESLWVRLLSVLDATGRRAEALEHYETVRRRLADELGADPGPQLRAMHTRLLAEEAPMTPVQPDAGRERLLPRQLPIEVAEFVGREKLLATMDGVLGDATSPLVITAIGGAAGIGKTALAVHWAHRVVHWFPDGQLYANLRGFDPSGSPRPPEEVLRGFLDALGVRPQQIPAGLEAQAGLYRSLLATRRMLVVLDNARDAEQVRPLLPGSPGSQVLVTSRDRLTSLVAVEGARPLVLDTLSTEEAWQLLERRLGIQRVTADPQATEGIIRRCAGLPLALAVVAARAIERPESSLATLTGELDGARADLDAFAAFADSDPVIDVRSVFSWSYRTLSAATARLFRLLSVHPGPDVSPPAAAAIAGLPLAETRTALRELIAAHLINEPVAGRYTVHDLLRAYSAELAEQLDADIERRDALLRMLDHYVHSGYSAAMLLYPQRQPITLSPPGPGVYPEEFADHHHAMSWCVAEHPVLLGVVERAAAEGLDAHAWRMAWALTDALDRHGHWQDMITTQLVAIQATRRLGEHSAQAQAHRDIARAYGILGRYDDAHTHLAMALELYIGIGDRIGEANTHRNISRILELQGRLSEAIGQMRQAMDLCHTAGDRVGQARALNGLSWYHSMLGEYEQALVYGEHALRLHRAVGNLYGQAATLDSLGVAHHHLGHRGEAVACLRAALELMRDRGDRYIEAEVLTHLGDAHDKAGAADAARAAWQQAWELFTALDRAEATEVRAKLDGIRVGG